MNFKNWLRRPISTPVLTYYYTLRSSSYGLLALFEVDLRILVGLLHGFYKRHYK